MFYPFIFHCSLFILIFGLSSYIMYFGQILLKKLYFGQINTAQPFVYCFAGTILGKAQILIQGA